MRDRVRLASAPAVVYTAAGDRRAANPSIRMIKGIGIDSIEIARVARIHAEYGVRLVERILTPSERDYVARYADPVPRIAGRFAAKEACMKALGTGWGAGVRWRDIDVRRHPGGQPFVELAGRARERLAALGASTVHCTITHTGDHAMAVVILE